MATNEDWWFTKGRVAQFLHERGYPVNDIPENGLSEQGYRTTVRDAGGRIMISGDEIVTCLNPWWSLDDWVEIEAIYRGEWE